MPSWSGRLRQHSAYSRMYVVSPVPGVSVQVWLLYRSVSRCIDISIAWRHHVLQDMFAARRLDPCLNQRPRLRVLRVVNPVLSCWSIARRGSWQTPKQGKSAALVGNGKAVRGTGNCKQIKSYVRKVGGPKAEKSLRKTLLRICTKIKRGLRSAQSV